ncbi:zinc-binding dehydrogenase [Streptomyces sp. NPDC059373]
MRETSLKVLAPFGRVVVFGDAGRHEDWTTSVRDLWKHNRSVSGFNIGDLARRAPELLAAYTRSSRELLAAGTVAVDITGTLPLAEAARAHKALEAGTTRGTVVLRVAE